MSLLTHQDGECFRPSLDASSDKVALSHLHNVLPIDLSEQDYTWTSGPNKKQVKVPAPEYTDYVLTVCHNLHNPSSYAYKC